MATFIKICRRLLKAELLAGDDKNRTGDNTVRALEFNRLSNKIKKEIEKTAKMQIQFCGYILEPSPDCIKFNETGIKLLSKHERIEQIWEAIQEIKAASLETHSLYCQYHLLVTYDYEAWKSLRQNRRTDMALALHNASIAATSSSNNNLVKTLANLNAKMNDQLPIIQVSGKEETIGKIINCNLPLCKLFGYLKEQLINSNISMLMPHIFAEHHNQLLMGHIKATEGQPAKNAEVAVLAKSSGGYIFPAWVKVTSAPNIEDGIIYIGTFEVERQQLTGALCYVLLDMHHKVLEISSNALNYLRLSSEIVNKCEVRWNNLMPEMFQSGMIEARFYGEGAPSVYYFPEYKAVTVPQQDGLPEDELKAGKPTILASQHFIVLRCKASECTMKNIGKIAILLTLDLVQHVGKISSTYILREGKDMSKGQILTSVPISVFNYSYTKNKYLKETIVRSPFEETPTQNQKSTSLKGSIEDKSQKAFSRSSSLFKVMGKNNAFIRESLFSPKLSITQQQKPKKSFYAMILAKFIKDLDQNTDVFANMKDMLIEKEKRNLAEGVDLYRIKPDSDEFEKISDECGLALLDDPLSANEILNADEVKRRKLQEEVSLLAQVELENKKSLQNTMVKFINLKLIKLAVLAIVLIITSILLCAILKFVFFRNQYAELTSLLQLSESQSIIVPDFLYCFLYLREGILCNQFAISELCGDQSAMTPLSPSSKLSEYLDEIFTAKTNLRIYLLSDDRTVKMYYPAYGMAELDYILRDSVQTVSCLKLRRSWCFNYIAAIKTT